MDRFRLTGAVFGPEAGTMASAFVDFCEQGNPKTLKEVQRESARADARRVQASFLAAVEKRALVAMALRTPEWVTPDHFTALGFVAQIGAGACFALARGNKFALVGVAVCLATNWLGDSMDGTLARVRQKERPRYGFYVDHMVDSFGATAVMSGLAVSGYMHPGIAVALLVAFLLLSIQSYLATYTLREFHLSFWKLGPTELRIALAVGALALLRWPVVLPGRWSLFDVGGTIGLMCMVAMLVWFTGKNEERLRKEERSRL
jgi:phosphatidylglycerophosphate synthase